ncbi:enoyl-CoA hydratase/isomerase family protein [Geitlerinema splendidum]|nr:enoyl-CoA hydratase/isomerase family protein [Geitlerinema splendidum]
MEPVQMERRGMVTWVWLNRPDKLNALNLPALNELQRIFTAFTDDHETRAVVLAGRGRAFCAGFDITWMAERTPESMREDRPHLREVYAAIERCPQPVISAVHGDSMGGGLILTMVSDIVLATPTARFGVPEVKIGIFPSLLLIPRLERLIGLRAAQDLALTGMPIGGERALELGLVTRLSADDALYEEAQRSAEALAALPVSAVQAIKASFMAHTQPGYTDWETEYAVKCWAAPEREVAMQAFLYRKRPSGI